MKNLEPISVANIGLGMLLAKADEHLAKISEDVVNRPGLKKARTVTITISLTPDEDQNTGYNMPDIDWNVRHKMPGAQGMTSKAFVMQEGEEQRVMVDPASMNSAQMGLFSGEDVPDEPDDKPEELQEKDDSGNVTPISR